jgi:hypothetical protein
MRSCRADPEKVRGIPGTASPLTCSCSSRQRANQQSVPTDSPNLVTTARGSWMWPEVAVISSPRCSAPIPICVAQCSTSPRPFLRRGCSSRAKAAIGAEIVFVAAGQAFKPDHLSARVLKIGDQVLHIVCVQLNVFGPYKNHPQRGPRENPAGIGLRRWATWSGSSPGSRGHLVTLGFQPT